MIDKKEIKRKYKETIQPMGLFVIKNLKNSRIFLGKSKNLSGQLNSERFQLEAGKHMNEELQQDFSAQGSDSFSFEVLDRLEPSDDPLYNYESDLKELEALWLEKLQPFPPNGYNKKKK